MALSLFQLICTHIQVSQRPQHIRKAKAGAGPPVQFLRFMVIALCLFQLSYTGLNVA